MTNQRTQHDILNDLAFLRTMAVENFIMDDEGEQLDKIANRLEELEAFVTKALTSKTPNEVQNNVQGS